MIRSQPSPLLDPSGTLPGEPRITIAAILRGGERVLARLLLAILLAAVAALIPGEAATILEARLTWTDLVERGSAYRNARRSAARAAW